ncbi:MAG: response regulator [Planctomycetes bacterium]|nr:response regulator [Planctomycetota bacterium]
MTGERILIVDDEEDVRALLSRILRPHGFDVKTAEGPETALKALEAFQPDLLITDIKMPGMDGVELARVVKKLSPRTGVIIMTAYATVDSAIDSLRLGVDNYIKKPIQLDELAEAVRTALDKRRSASDGADMGSEPRHGQDVRRAEAPGSARSRSRATARPQAGSQAPEAPKRPPGVIHLAAATPTARERSSPPTVLVRAFPFYLGREPYGMEDGPISNTDLTIQDEPPFQVSRRHCSIEQEADGYCICDVNSRLGTIVNGERIGPRMPVAAAPLKPGKNTLVLGGRRSPFVFSVLVKGS